MLGRGTGKNIFNRFVSEEQFFHGASKYQVNEFIPRSAEQDLTDVNLVTFRNSSNVADF